MEGAERGGISLTSFGVFLGTGHRHSELSAGIVHTSSPNRAMVSASLIVSAWCGRR